MTKKENNNEWIEKLKEEFLKYLKKESLRRKEEQHLNRRTVLRGENGLQETRTSQTRDL